MKKLLYLAVLTMVLTACGDSSKESPNNPSETKGMPFYDAYDNYVGIQVNDSMIEADESYLEIMDAEWAECRKRALELKEQELQAAQKYQ